jgi:hypothetical protein
VGLLTDHFDHPRCHETLEQVLRVADGSADMGDLIMLRNALRSLASTRQWRSTNEYYGEMGMSYLLRSAVRDATQPDIRVGVLNAIRNTLAVSYHAANGSTQPRPAIMSPADMRATLRVLILDIIGNPFRPLTLDLAWQTSTAVLLARGMYESRDFSAMPILADALQDAGCDNDDVLGHCRVPGPHVRGCWVIDLVLGKS